MMKDTKAVLDGNPRHTGTPLRLKASTIAEYVGRHMPSAHRGALPYGLPGVLVLFGNDGFATDQRTKREVETVTQSLRLLGAEDLEFGTDKAGDSWAIIATLPEFPVHTAVRDVADLAWDVWYSAGDFRKRGTIGRVQRRIAHQVIAQAGPVTAWRLPEAELAG